MSIGVCATALAVLWLAAPAHADRDKQWKLVHGQCVPHQQAGEAPPEPCDRVDLAAGEEQGVALLKDDSGVAQVLTIPTRHVTGIEDPFLLSPVAPNYFATAWTGGRARFEAYLKTSPPRDEVGVTSIRAARAPRTSFICTSPASGRTSRRRSPPTSPCSTRPGGQ